jgi:hypothetical protein
MQSYNSIANDIMINDDRSENFSNSIVLRKFWLCNYNHYAATM